MIGSIGYATQQGLGIMAKSFYDNGVIDKFLIVPHAHHKNHLDWYKEVKMFPNDLEWLLKDITTLFLFETPFNWKIIPQARDRGIKVILQPNECTRYPFPYEPDLIHCPSLLEMEIYKDKNCVFIPVPVDIKWRLRERAKIFIHNAGHGGLGGRNGTQELIDAMKFVKSPIKLIIRTQTNKFESNDPRVEIRFGSVPHEELWDEGDVFIFPDKFAGLSLPLQEAFASGMLIMTSNRFPLNTWLPTEPLIPVSWYKKETIGGTIDSAVINIEDIAKTIDSWYDKDITSFSLIGKEWGEKNSWKILKEKYVSLDTSIQSI